MSRPTAHSQVAMGAAGAAEVRQQPHEVAAPAGPQVPWTPAQTRTVLGLLFGHTARGGPDLLEAAQALSVSQPRLQRWIAAPGTKRHRDLPWSYYELLADWVRPPARIMRQEHIAEQYARDAIAAIGLRGGRGVDPAWVRRRWLEPHVVAVVSREDLNLERVTVSRATAGPLGTLKDRGHVVDFITVDNRFAGTVAKAQMLSAVTPWRAQAPISHMPLGNTETWLAGAARPQLGDLPPATVPS